MPRAGRRLFRVHRRSAVRRRHCMSGLRRPRSTAANDPACHRMFRTGSRRWSARTGSLAGPMRFCARRRPFSPRRSSTADRSDGVVHRRPPCRVRGRVDLRADADRSLVQYYEAQGARGHDPGQLPPRLQRDRALTREIRRVHDENFGVYGARKVWRQLRARARRCPLHRGAADATLGLQGVVRGSPCGPRSPTRRRRPLDRVNRQFHAPARMSCGYPISPMFRPGLALSMSRS